MGFDAKWGVLGAADIGAPHQRDRIWIVGKKRTLAHTLSARQRGNEWKSQNEKNVSKQMAYTSEIGLCGSKTKQGMAREFRFAECGMDRKWWEREPDNASRTIERNMGGVVDGVASRVDRLKAIGNGQVPLCAATAWRILNDF